MIVSKNLYYMGWMGWFKTVTSIVQEEEIRRQEDQIWV
jgi:hypothetical protein